MLNITTDILKENGFRQRDNTNWWSYQGSQIFWVNLLSRTIRLNTYDRPLDFELEEDTYIAELVSLAESWRAINYLERKK